MSSAPGLDCDVLIVGAGPTGVTLALLLARRGVRVIVAEKEAEVHPLPRAAHLDHETMRILQEAGAAEQVMATSRTTDRYEFRSASGEILLCFDGSNRIGPGGWPGANMIHQPSVERALRAQLAGHPGAELRSGSEVLDFKDDGQGVTVRIATPQGEQVLRARYLVGADGARSPVRKLLDVGFEDLGFEEPWLVVDALVLDPARLPTCNLQICDPARPTTCVLMGAGRHRWEFMILPGEDPAALSSDESVARLLEPWDVAGAITLERKAIYTFRARIARQWRKGRVLLAGDAAHQTPPFAGQGLCSGLRDAANLAWKLAAIVQHGAADTLLDSYQPEREPNLRATIAMAIMMGRTVCITDHAAAAARDAQMLTARQAGQSPDGALGYPPIDAGVIMAGTPAAGSYFPQAVNGDARLDDVLGPGAWLIERAGLDAVHLTPFRSQLQAWFDTAGVDAVLVRPDRHVFASGDAAVIADAWTEVTRTRPIVVQR